MATRRSYHHESYSQQHQQQLGQRKHGRFQDKVSLSISSDSSSSSSSSAQQQLEEGEALPRTTATTTTSKNKKNERKKSKKKQRQKVQLYRADRVLANRSGKSRSECFKLLQKYAISILETDDNNNNNNEDDDTTSSQLKLRKLKGPKEKIPMNARIFINHKFEVPALPPLLSVFHKPKWVLSTMGMDARGRRNLQDFISNYSNNDVQNMHPVGRLDYDTSGLLLFSSSGTLTQTLLHPKYEKEKEYVAVVVGTVDETELRTKLQSGIELVDLAAKKKNKQNKEPTKMIMGVEEATTTTDATATCTTRDDDGDDDDASRSSSISIGGDTDTDDDDDDGDDDHNDEESKDQNELSNSNSNQQQQQKKKKPPTTFTTRAEILQVRHWPSSDVAPYVDSIRSNLPPEYNVTDLKIRGFLDILEAKELSEVRLIVQEGKHRMVRRMLATCGHPVVSLKRERMGVIELGDLKEGSFRNLTAKEEAWANNLVVD